MTIVATKAIQEAARLAWADGDYRLHNALCLLILVDDYADDSQFWRFISQQAEKVAKEKLPKP